VIEKATPVERWPYLTEHINWQYCRRQAVLENTSSVRSRKWGNRFMNSYAMQDRSTCLVNQINSTPPGDESYSQYAGKYESEVLWL
jgi:hypothetical protein